MEILKLSSAGTLESSDAQITVEPSDKLEISIDSSVINQYGKQIKKVVQDTLKRLDVKKGKISVNDRGALDCTLKARLECAIYRSNDQVDHLPWEGAIK